MQSIQNYHYANVKKMGRCLLLGLCKFTATGTFTRNYYIGNFTLKQAKEITKKHHCKIYVYCSMFSINKMIANSHTKLV